MAKITVRATEHLEPDQSPPKINPHMPVGYVKIPMEALKQAVFENTMRNDPEAPFKTFDDYHRWYVGHGGYHDGD